MVASPRRCDQFSMVASAQARSRAISGTSLLGDGDLSVLRDNRRRSDLVHDLQEKRFGAKYFHLGIDLFFAADRNGDGRSLTESGRRIQSGVFAAQLDKELRLRAVALRKVKGIGRRHEHRHRDKTECLPLMAQHDSQEIARGYLLRGTARSIQHSFRHPVDRRSVVSGARSHVYWQTSRQALREPHAACGDWASPAQRTRLEFQIAHLGGGRKQSQAAIECRSGRDRAAIWSAGRARSVGQTGHPVPSETDEHHCP